MPSSALAKLRSNLVDVHRLIESHSDLGGEARGRRSLGHITRAGVLLLCAAWERYIELLLAESVGVLCEAMPLPTDLPKPVQKHLSTLVKEARHQLRPLHLAGEGWKLVYKSYAQDAAASLNTPSSKNIDRLFLDFIGLGAVSQSWSQGVAAVDAFVTLRGDVAHRGREAQYIRIENLRDFRTLLLATAIDTDNGLSDYLKATCPGGERPWNRARAT